MIPIKVDGRTGVVAYFDAQFALVDPDDPSAVLAKIAFDDGGNAFYAVGPPTPTADPRTAADWDESRHPRHPAGSSDGGQFAPSSGADGSASPTRYDSDGNPIARFSTPMEEHAGQYGYPRMGWPQWRERAIYQGYFPPQIDAAREIAEQFGEDITGSDDIDDFSQYMEDKYGEQFTAAADEIAETLPPEPAGQGLGEGVGRMPPDAMPKGEPVSAPGRVIVDNSGPVTAPSSYVAEIQSVAEEMNFPPDHITIEWFDEHFTVGDKEFKGAAFYDPNTGRIRVNSESLDRMSSRAEVRDMIAHEISHNAYVALKRDVAGPSPSKEAMDFSSTMGEEAETLQSADGVSSYSKVYWNALSQVDPGVDPDEYDERFDTAINETLAEITGLVARAGGATSPALDHVHPTWVDLWFAMNRAYGARLKSGRGALPGMGGIIPAGGD